jgi:hypothetical protein
MRLTLDSFLLGLESSPRSVDVLPELRDRGVALLKRVPRSAVLLTHILCLAFYLLEIF